MIVSPFCSFANSTKSETIIDTVSNQTKSDEILKNNTKILEGVYTLDEINEIIYRLEDDILNNNTNSGHYRAVTASINFICGSQFYEDPIEACGVVTQLPIE